MSNVLSVEIFYEAMDLSDDVDGDGFNICEGDCNDIAANMFPGSGLESESDECMQDSDNDGYGSMNVEEPYTTGTDCDDNDAFAYPNAPEICNNGIDENCDGSDPLTCDIETPTIIEDSVNLSQCSSYELDFESDETITQIIWTLEQDTRRLDFINN